MLILNKTRINILVDVHFLIPTFQVVLIHINKVGNRINKVGHETTKWVNESTKWVNESTSWTAPNQPRGSRQLYAYYKSRFIFLHFFEPTSQEFHLGSISMKMCQIWCFLCNEQMLLHRLTFVLKIVLCLGKYSWNNLILFLPGVESGIAIGDTYPVPPCFTDLTKKW